ncbi:MAG: undecaprenyldiphospho-muramoylpentapeptide beta-N-acetylglucosaminyltransferase [Actinomycetaceae bacterium]|nr:undecaprenyldiphospho-muramoylpentapeptide beta-N-acetylglucosaminyltransferase [Actinomycetaceae bacterium]
MIAGPKVLLAGGGSAGHVNPLLSVADTLQNRGFIPEALGTAEGLEAELVPAAGLALHTIDKVPAPRSVNSDIFRFVPRLKATIAEVEKIIRSSGSEIVVGFGGYVSAPAYLAAQRVGIPFAIHEQNVRPGLANRLGARAAKVVALTFENTKLRAKRGTTEVVGLPLRPEIERLARDRQDPKKRRQRRVAAARELGIDPKRPTVLLTGGSLGAQRLNDVMSQAAGHFDSRVQIIHLTGYGKADGIAQTVAHSGFTGSWKVVEYARNMEFFYAVADLVICRAGAGTVSELTALGMPAVYIPLPIGNGEQRLNAAAHVQSGGALLFDNSDLSDQIVRLWIAPLATATDRLSKMSRSSRRLGRIDAAARMGELIESLVQPQLEVRP